MINFSNILSNSLFITLMSAGLCVWLVGIFVIRNLPKNRNAIYGYRTPAAMKSQEAWDYAQIHGTRRMIIGSQILCLLGLMSIFVQVDEMVGTFVALALILLALLAPLVITERELKDKF